MKSLSQKINESLNESSSDDKQAYGEVRSFSEFQKGPYRPEYLLIDKTSNKIVAGFARMNVPKAGQKDYMNKNHQLISTSSAKNPAPYLDQKPIDYDDKKNWLNEGIEDFGDVNEARLSDKSSKNILVEYCVNFIDQLKEQDFKKLNIEVIKQFGGGYSIKDVVWEACSLSQLREIASISFKMFPSWKDSREEEIVALKSALNEDVNEGKFDSCKNQGEIERKLDKKNGKLVFTKDALDKYRKLHIDYGSTWAKTMSDNELEDRFIAGDDERFIKINEDINESLSALDLKANKTYLVKKGKVEAYAEYKSSKDGKHFFDNSGEMIEVSDSELGKCVVNEAKIDTSNKSYKDGFWSFQTNKKLTANPHDKDSDDFTQWSFGWNAAKDDAANAHDKK